MNKEIFNHEIEAPVEGCSCFFCEETREEASTLHLTPKGQELILVPKRYGVVVRPRYCPECARPVDDPDGCRNCNFQFEIPNEKISILGFGDIQTIN